MKLISRLAPAAALLALFVGCASHPPAPHEDGLALMAQGRYEEGIALLEQDIRRDPGNFKFRTDLINARERALNRLVGQAADERAAGSFDRAVELYRRAIGIEPGNERARIGLLEIDRDRAHVENAALARKLRDDGDIEGAWTRVQAILREDPAQRQALELKRQIEETRARELASVPTLRSMYDGPPLTMKFRDADLRQVFDVLSRESGVTVVFDRDVRADLRATIVARQIAFEDAFDLLLMSNQLEKKIINRNTVLIYPVTAEKLRQYQDLAVKGFYLTYADVKQTAELLKAVLKPTEMFVDDKMNMIVLRDTPEAISIAEKLIAMHDLTAPEVMLDLEVLEVQRNKLVEMGIQWPNQLVLAPLPSNGQTTTLRDITGITSATTSAQLANMIINLRKETGAANLLANPRVRSLNHQKANILIGSKVPVVTTTATATGFASQSVQYLDVGLKLEVEPSIHLQDEVEIRLALEVSSIASQIQTAGVLTYQIGTRNASTILRMRDGETQVLAGLINDQDTRNSSGVPGLGDIPVVGRLFRSQKDDSQKTEIMLLVTPHLVRNITLPHATASEFLSGSETSPKTPSRSAALAARKAGDAAVAQANAAPVPVPVATAAEPPSATAPPVMALDWSGPKEARVGEQFTLVLRMNSGSPLKSVPMQIAFDPSALEVVKVSEGGFFKVGNAQGAFANRVDAPMGQIAVGVSAVGAEGATGQGELATITFRARTPRPRTEVRVLSVAAMSPAGTSANVAVPAPWSLSLVK